MKAGLILLACVAMAGCESIRQNRELARRAHSFEPKLLVADKSVPHLEKTEWDEIRAQFVKYTDYNFRGADRLNDDAVRVRLEQKSDQYQGLELRFERANGHWTENLSRTRKVEYLIP